MRPLFLIVLFSFSLISTSQTHQIGISGGVNSTLSWDGSPPFREGSPYNAKLGYSVNLSYCYVFENNLTLSLRNSLTFYNFQANDFIVNIDNKNGDPLRADKKLLLSYYQIGLGGGYLFDIGERYTLGVEIGASMLYNYRQASYSVGYPETESETKWPWDKRNRYYGVFLSLRNSYELYSARKHTMYVTGAVRATQVFNYGLSDSGLNRVLPEITLGVAVAFGKSGGSRF